MIPYGSLKGMTSPDLWGDSDFTGELVVEYRIMKEFICCFQLPVPCVQGMAGR